ncbi:MULTISPECIES: TIGR02300 family protein [unclassified Roseitalea]|uniref:TIGR02300 family protein n=1 Tax=unclassified Roseitalea TaxID=2639107 RepID=UPI0027401348|nr:MULTISPECIES: TIGR02300 family protein [unclassified Roseitalea]
MAKPEFGTKRVCPETGRKFYDLNKDPIVSPYTGKSYPLSFFEDTGSEVIAAKPEPAEEPAETAEDEVDLETATVVSLEDADEETAEDGKNIPDLGDDSDDEPLAEENDEDDTFLPDDDADEEDDVTGIVDISTGDDED